VVGDTDGLQNIAQKKEKDHVDAVPEAEAQLQTEQGPVQVVGALAGRAAMRSVRQSVCIEMN